MAAEAQSVSTSLASMRAPAAQTDNLPVRMGFDTERGFELLQRAAKMYAASSLVPAIYQGNIANCAIAVNMSNRLGADTLLVMQNLYIVHGNPGWSSKFLIASVNTCGRYSALRYEWRGKEGADDFGCRAWAIEKDTGERLNGTWIDWKMVKAEGWSKKAGSKWLTMPEQMFVYRAAAFWQRAYAPEISMGLQTVEDLEDALVAKRDASGQFVVDVETLRETTPPRPAQPAPSETAGAPSIEPAMAQLREAGDLAALREAWTNISREYGGMVPLDVEAFYNVRQDVLAEASRGGAK